MTKISPTDDVRQTLRKLGVPDDLWTKGSRPVASPITGEIVAHVDDATPAQVSEAAQRADTAFLIWRTTPAPVRGELVRRFGMALRTHKAALGRLVTLDCGKPISEGLGEVQEMIDICDFAVGISRQLHGLTIASERPMHRMMETWHPLGPVGIISAFNFPVAVWSWNAALALVCGNPIIWKPSEKSPLTALAVQAIFEAVAKDMEGVPPHLSQLLLGGADIGIALVEDARIRLVSATGSTRMGRSVGQKMARRFGRALLELGGNNATIVTPSADMDLALRASAFGFMGTSGQRCTSLRRLFLHRSIHDSFLERLTAATASIRIGDPRDTSTLMGPLIDEDALSAMHSALGAARAVGGRLLAGGERIDRPGTYVTPALVSMARQRGLMLQETFAPILYVCAFDDLEEAIALQNGVAQGLSSSIFTNDLREAELFTSAAGSDCGIANVNIGTSGAEIGGAFGGEKETGGGRESGSDSWKAYMRRQTSTINYGNALPLAQGVSFDLE